MENIFDLLKSDNTSLGECDLKEEMDFNPPLMDTSSDINMMDDPFQSIDSLADLNATNLIAMENSYDLIDSKNEFNFEEFFNNDSVPVFDLNESCSDSGLSNNADNFILSPPSSGIISPDPRGDVSVDTLDASSDVSSTSDLGSAYSFTSSPVRSSSIGLDSISDDVIEIKDSPPRSTCFFSEQNTNRTRLNVKNVTLLTKSRPISTQNITLATQPQQILPTFKIDSPNGPKIVSIKTLTNSKYPILKRLQLDPTKQSNQQIVVTRANTLQLTTNKFKSGFKSINGKSVVLQVPMKVNEFINMQKVKNINIYNPVNVTENRTVLTVDKSQIIGNTASPRNPTFFTSKVIEGGRTHLKVSPANLESYKIAPTFTIKEELSSSEDEETPQQGQRLILSEEEKRLMRKEGMTLPARYPLTKQEERDLKRIRRKIRNKKSAQDSRKRKKEYVDGLEDRLKLCTNENQQLHKKIRCLEKSHENLSVQLKRFQNFIGQNLNSKSHNHTSTALMMLILSAALIVVPSLRPQEGKGENDISSNTKMPNSGHSRTLLETAGSTSMPFNSNNLEMFDDDEDMELVESFNGALSDHDYEPSIKRIRSDPFMTPSIGNGISKGDPPDGERKGVYAMLGAMLHQLGSNWTDPGGTDWTNKTPKPDSSVVVNINRTLLDDIELE